MSELYAFNFKCGICSKSIVLGDKFTIESTEWESATEGCGGGIDEESICKSCHDYIRDNINLMRK